MLRSRINGRSALKKKDGFGKRIYKDGAWQNFKEKVESTHSFNEDPRKDHFLHSVARQFRYLKKVIREND